MGRNRKNPGKIPSITDDDYFDASSSDPLLPPMPSSSLTADSSLAPEATGIDFITAADANHWRTGTGKHILVIKKGDDIPQTPEDFRNLMLKSGFNNIEYYERTGGKKGGVNDAGELGGQYNLYYHIEGEVDAAGQPLIRSQRCLFKQDNGYKNKAAKVLAKNVVTGALVAPLATKEVLAEKVIGEFLVSRMMNSLIPGSSSSICYMHTGKKPDKTGKSVYLGIPFFPNCDDLTKDLYRVQNRPVPAGNKRLFMAGTYNNNIFQAGLLVTNKNNEILYFDEQGEVAYTRKPQFGLYNVYRDKNGKEISASDALKTNARPRCRFHDLGRTCMPSLYYGDFDIQTGNLLIEPNHPRQADNDFLRDSQNNIVEDEYGKIGRFIRIDQAAGLHNLSDTVNLHSLLDHIPGLEPTNHWREFPRDLRISKDVAEEADRIANFPVEKEEKAAASAISETLEYLGAKPFADFMKRLGMNLDSVLQAYNATRGLDAIPDIRARLENGTLEDPDDYTIDNHLKKFLGEQTLLYLVDKLKHRKESFKRYAFDVKLSLCVRRLPDGEFHIDERDYKLRDLVAQYPEYMHDSDIHLRSKEHVKYTVGTHNVVYDEAKEATIKGLTDSMTKTVAHSLGTNLGDLSHFATRFYAKPAAHEQSQVPSGVYHVVVSPRELLAEFKDIAKQQKRLEPHLATEAAGKVDVLRRGQYALNFVGTNSRTGNSAYYIEHVKPDDNYQSTVHRLPPEIDSQTIFMEQLLKHCDPERLRAHNFSMDILKHLAGLVTLEVDASGQQTMNFSQLNAEMCKDLSLLLRNPPANVDDDPVAALQPFFNTISNDMVLAYCTATQHPTEPLPAAAYLKFAETQCQSFHIAQGKDATIVILPRATEDPLLMRAYALVCEINGWKYDNKSHLHTQHPELFAEDKRHLTAATTALNDSKKVEVTPTPAIVIKPSS